MKFFAVASLLAVGAFASSCHPDYPCCNGCDIIYSDAEGDWGVENNDWCFIQSKCYSGSISEYPNCNGCTVVYTDETGDWGVEKNNWCLIPKKCNNNPGHNNYSGPDSIPVITLISSSGNSDFASKPVEKHIAQQAYMGKQMPPEPFYEDCTITVEDSDGTKVINSVAGKVKVRGNWTSNYAKKGLRINFNDSQSMLGLNNGNKFKNWVLLAEYKDGSMLRNKSAFDISRGILGPDGYYASDGKLVELRINDEYFGVYLLAEQQQINKGRIDITKGKDDYTGTDIGYLLEFDNGYTSYEDDIQKFKVDFNNNAPLKPFDGNGGSGKTIEPSGSFGFGGGSWGFPGNSGGIPGNGGGNWNIPGNTGNNSPQGPQGPQAGNGNTGNNGWNFPGFGNQNNNGGQQQQPNNGWGGFGNQNTDGEQSNNAWGGFGNWGNNMKKRQFFGGNGENMTIKNDMFSQQQHDFIANFVNNAYNIMYEAAYNRKTLKFTNDYSRVVEAPELTPRQAIENVLEADSLADLFIISEMTCDADLYYSSFYIDVDFGPNGSKKLRFEAPWDFDSALGNKDRCADGKGHFAANITPDNGNMGGQKINPWLAVIMYEDWYQDLIKSKWTKAYDSGVLNSVVDMIHTETSNAAPAFERNYAKWDNINQNSQFVNELSPEAKQCKTQSEAANYLAKWITNRIAFVNSFWHK